MGSNHQQSYKKYVTPKIRVTIAFAFSNIFPRQMESAIKTREKFKLRRITFINQRSYYSNCLKKCLQRLNPKENKLIPNYQFGFTFTLKKLLIMFCIYQKLKKILAQNFCILSKLQIISYQAVEWAIKSIYHCFESTPKQCLGSVLFIQLTYLQQLQLHLLHLRTC